MIIVENKEIIIEMSQRGPTGKRGLKGDPGTTSWNDLEDRPTLGALADHDTVNYETEIDNLPTLGALADHDTIDYNTEIDNLPTLGDLAAKDKVDYENDIDNLPTLGALADHDTIDYNTEIDNLPTLGTMSEVDDAPSDSKEYARKDGEWVRVTDNAAAWGKIIGNIANQTDLNSELMRKAAVDHVHGNLNTAGEVTGGSYAITNGDRMLISDASHDNRLRSSNVIFDGSSIDKGLTQKGTFESFAVPEMLFDSEESMTATRDYVEGDLIAVGRYLYVTLSNIASGTTLVPGANVSVTTLEEQVYTKSETNDLLSAKADSADLGDLAAKDKVDWDTDIDDIPETFPPAPHNHDDRYYTESETDNLLAGKQPTLTFDNTPTADSTNPVTSGGVKTALDAKANSANVYTKAQANGLLDAKANSADVYTKTAADELLDEKLDTDADTTLIGDILTFDAPVDNAIKGLTVDIDPVQDLHGYDAPWPAGGGKNLYPNSIISGTENGFTVTQDGDKYVLSATNQTTYAQRISSETISLKAGTYTSSLFGGPDSSITFQLRSLDGLTTYTYAALGGRPHTFTLAEDTVVKPRFTSNKTGSFTYTATVQIEQGSTATSFAPYSNVCPISGQTQAVVTRTGKNLWDKANAVWYRNNSSNFSETTDNSTTRIRSNSLPIRCGGNTITVSGLPSGISLIQIRFYDKYKNKISEVSTQATATAPSGTEYLHLLCGGSDFTSQTNQDMANANLQLELGSTATAYAPYNGTSLTIDLDGTRYGGTINVLTGELTVDREYHSFTGTENNMGTYSAGDDRLPFYQAGNGKNDGYVLSNMLERTTSYITLMDKVGTVRPAQNGQAIHINNTFKGQNFTVDEFKSYLADLNTAGTPLQIVYELATPQTIQLTANQVSTLIGENHLWANTGNSTIILRIGAGQFAYQDVIDYDSDYLTNKPDLGQKADIIKSSASGSLVHITDGAAYPVDSLSVAIEPVQDLHGYDAPWPAGGGVNVLPAYDLALLKSRNTAGTWNGNAYTQDGIAFTFTFGEDGLLQTVIANGTATDNISFRISPNTISNTLNGYVLNGAPNINGCTMQMYNESTGNSIYATSNGSTITFANGDLIRYFCRIVSGTQLTNAVFRPIVSANNASYTPYSNVCPISGHTSAVVTRTGKNLLAYPYESIRREVNGVTISANADGSVTASGTYTGTDPVNFFLKANGAGSGLPAGTYIFSNDTNRGNDKICCVAGSSGSDFSYANVDKSTPFTFTLAHDNDTIGYCLVQVLVGFTGTFTVHPMIRLASVSDATFEPYQGTVTIDLDGTRYGGTLNVLTGEMRVTHAIWTMSNTVTGKDWTYQNASGHERFGCTYLNDVIKKPNTSSELTDIICTSYKTITAGQTYAHSAGIGVGIDSNGVVWVYDPAYTEVSTFKTAIANEQIVYPLATPLTVTLTPATLSMLLGENNIWADTGDTEVTYRADTKLYIDQKIAASALATRSLITAVTTAMVAPKNLVANDLLIVNDDLIKITANVNNGGTLTLGTNCSKLTLAEYILSVIS